MKPLIYSILFYVAAALIFFIVMRKSEEHQCIDMTHQICDGQCDCDGVECPPFTFKGVILLRDYQINVSNDSILLWDGNRFVGGSTWENFKLDSLILKDNL